MSGPSNTRFLTIGIVFAIVLGALVGWALPGVAPYVSWLGQIFKLSLAMIVMPLVLTSIMDGMNSVGDVRRLGRIGGKTLAYYFSTTIIAVIIGLTLVSQIQPGVRAPAAAQEYALLEVDPGFAKMGPDAILSALPDLKVAEKQQLKAILEKMASQDQSVKAQKEAALRWLGALEMRSRAQDKASTQPVDPPSAGAFLRKQLDKALVNPFKALASNNVLAVIVFAILLGGALTTLGRRGREVLAFNHTVNLAIGKIVGLIMLFAPFGVFGLLVDVVAATGPEVFKDLGKYALCVACGLLIHVGIVLPGIAWLFTRTSPVKLFVGIGEALSVAFSTSSSNATLPVTMKCVEDNLGVDKRVSGFVLPLGATVNMDGTALYEAVAAVFIAQLYGVALDVSAQVMVAITAVLAAIGAAGIPAAGTVTMAMVLAAVGLPLEGIGLLLAVDRPLDMCRTATNVTGDGVGALVLNRWAKDDFPSGDLVQDVEANAT